MNTSNNCGCEDELNPQEEICQGIYVKDLPSLLNISPNDLLYIVKESTGTSYKITVEDLAEKLQELVPKTEPTFFDYTNLEELEIIYTPDLKLKYGKIPTITIYDLNYKIVALTDISFDSLTNPTVITISTEGEYNLIIKMS